MNHDITVRKMDFELPEHIDPVLVPGRPEESFVYMGISLILPHLEPYLIRTMKVAGRELRDPALREQVRRFSAQEGQHYRQHIDYNRATGVLGVEAVKALDREIAEAFARYTKTRSLRFNLAYAEGFEAATSALGLAAFSIKLFDDLSPPSSELWRWHLVEELEHRTVAFDVYERLVGDYGYRLAVSLFVHWQLARFAVRVAGALLRADPALLTQLGGRAGRRRRILRFLRTLGRHALPRLLRTYLPTYSPHRLKIPAGVAELAHRYSAEALRTS